jgi:hypothetical protein
MRFPWRHSRQHDPAAGLGDLEAALKEDCCPVCARTAGADERWLDRFLDGGYLERNVMRSIAESGGFCAFHAARITEIGQSATVALIYLDLIEYCLPRFAARRLSRGGPSPVFPMPDACAACAHQQEVERRECFFLALLIRTHGSRCYGAPALVCMRHLPFLLEYLEERSIGDVLAHHLGVAAALKPKNAADAILRLILGPAHPTADPPAPLPDSGCTDIPDPVRRMRHRLCALPSCPICAEVMDARSEWLAWLASASEKGRKVSDVLPLCRDHVSQAHTVGGSALAPALAAVVLGEAKQRLGFAANSAAACRGSRRLLDRIGGALGAAPGRHAALASLRRGRECPLCVRGHEAGERALSLLAALVESVGGRRAFENGYGLCVRHAARAMVMPDAAGFGEFVAETMHARLALLRWELEEQLRRGAWQSRPTRRGVESAAWLRAGTRFAGTV